jgi:hypothetical protein
MCFVGGLSYLTGQETEPVGFCDNFQCDQSPITICISKECLLELLQSVLIEKCVLGSWKGTEVHVLEH